MSSTNGKPRQPRDPIPVKVYRTTLLSRPWVFAYVGIFVLFPVSLWLGRYADWVGPAYLFLTMTVLLVLVPWWIRRSGMPN